MSAEISSKSLDINHKSPHVRESRKALDSGFHAGDSGFQVVDSGFFVSGTWIPDSKQLLDEVFVISRIIKVEVEVISRSRRLRLITFRDLDCSGSQKANLIIIL